MRARVVAAVAVLGTVAAGVVTAGTAVAGTSCAPPVVSVAGTQQYEGSGAGTKTFALTVTMAAPAAGCPASGSVSYRTVDGTAVAASDYVARTGTLSWTEAGTRTATVQVQRDSTDEPDERFIVELFGARGVSLGTSSATATVLDDDPGAAGPGVMTSVPNSGICWWPSSECPIPVRINTVAKAAVTVDVTVLDGTAIAWRDYAPVKKETVRIAAGADHVDVPIQLLPEAQAGRNFEVEIYNPSAGTIDVGKGEFTIKER